MILTLHKYIADIEEIFISQVAFIPPAESLESLWPLSGPLHPLL